MVDTGGGHRGSCKPLLILNSQAGQEVLFQTLLLKVSTGFTCKSPIVSRGAVMEDERFGGELCEVSRLHSALFRVLLDIL